MDLLFTLAALTTVVFLYWFANRNPVTFVRCLINLARKILRFRRKSLRVDNLDWIYLESEAPGKPTLVLLHGFGADKDNWLTYALSFKKKYRIIIPDLPGFGESQKIDLDYSGVAEARRLNQFLTELDPNLSMDNIHLCGHSMGGFIAMQYALSFPQRLQSLTLMSAAGVQGLDQSELDRAIAQGNNPLQLKSYSEIDWFLSLATHRRLPIPSAFKKYLFAMLSENREFNDRIFWQLLDETNGSPYLTDDIHRIKAPTLCLWGQCDRLVDVSCAHMIGKEIKGAQLHIYNNVGHLPMIEAGTKCAQDHLEFLSKNCYP